MVIDTSALVALLLGEPGADRIAQAIEDASPRLPLLFCGDDFARTDVDRVLA